MLNAYFVWSTGAQLERRFAALRQAGDPVQLADLAREPVPPEKNADAFLRRAADDLDAIQKELLASYPKRGYSTGSLSPVDGDVAADASLAPRRQSRRVGGMMFALTDLLEHRRLTRR